MRTMAALGLAATLSVAGATAPALAQSGRDSSAFQIRLGGFFPEGGGEFWDETESVFTLDHDDFDGASLGLSFVSTINNHLEVGLNADFFEEEAVSFYRGEVTPVGHETTLSTVPVTLDLRFLPGGRFRGTPRGAVRKPVFYVGAGVGINFWEYEEIGDFIDFSVDPNEIFFDRFREDGEALQVHVMAGVELPLSPGFNLLIEGRRSWADDNMSGDFAGLGDIELGGSSGFIGGSFRW